MEQSSICEDSSVPDSNLRWNVPLSNGTRSQDDTDSKEHQSLNNVPLQDGTFHLKNQNGTLQPSKDAGCSTVPLETGDMGEGVSDKPQITRAYRAEVDGKSITVINS